VTWNRRRRKLFYSSTGRIWRFLLRWAIFCAIIVSPYAATLTRAESRAPAKDEAGSLPDARIDSLPIRITVVDGQHIRFRRLSGGAGLSQTRVGWVVRDNMGLYGLELSMDSIDTTAIDRKYSSTNPDAQIA
jgi:hypothetical protein